MPARRPLADVMTALACTAAWPRPGLALAPNAERRLHDRRTPRPPLSARAARREAWPSPPAASSQPRRAALRIPGRTRARGATPPAAAAPPWSEEAWPGATATRRTQRRHRRVRTQIEYELALIAELGYEPYFLTVHDIVRFARSRASCARAAARQPTRRVCWALGITEVDPTLGHQPAVRALHLRRERNEPPDIDVDFEHDRREEVIQYIYPSTAATARRWPPPSSATAPAARCATSAARCGLGRDADRTPDARATAGGTAASVPARAPG